MRMCVGLAASVCLKFMCEHNAHQHHHSATGCNEMQKENINTHTRTHNFCIFPSGFKKCADSKELKNLYGHTVTRFYIIKVGVIIPWGKMSCGDPDSFWPKACLTF